MLIDADTREAGLRLSGPTPKPRRRLRGWRIAALVLTIGLLPLIAGSAYLQIQAKDRAREALDLELANSSQVAARTLDAYFDRAATVAALAASSPELARDAAGADRGSPAMRRRLERSLDYVVRMYPRGSLGRIAYLDASGAELARIEGGAGAPAPRLSRDERGRSYFRRAMDLRIGEVAQTAPYAASGSGQWVISSASPVGRPGRPPAGIVRFELRLESFRVAVAQVVPEHDTLVVDRHGGDAIFSTARVVLPRAPLVADGDRSVARVVDGSVAGLRDVRSDDGSVSGRAALRRVGHVPANVNDWDVVVAADRPSVLLLNGAAVPFAIMALVLLLIGLGLARWGNLILAVLAQTVERAGERRLDAVARNSSDVVTVLGPDGEIHVQTGAIAETLGYRPDELEGTLFADLIHPDDRATAASFLERPSRPGQAPRRVEWRLRHGDGTWRYIETIATGLTGDDAFAGTVLTSRDIGARKQLEDQLRHRAFHDPLTQLPNRALFYDRIGHALARKRRSERLVGVLFVDVDDFKLINDRFGHAGGDEVLVGVAGRLRSALRSADTVARFGGDEFGVLLEDIDGKGEAEATADRILAAFREPLLLHGEQIFIKPSVGVALGEPRVSTVEEVLRRADVAMYAAKRGGKGCFQLFDEKLEASVPDVRDRGGRDDADRLTWFVRGEEQREQIVAVLATDDAITTVFQPLVDLRTGAVVGYEALSRFKDPERRPPNAWFAQAARCGLGTQLEARAIEVALASARDRPQGVYVSLNLSPSSMLAEEVARVLPQDLNGIVIEITENELLFGGEQLSRAIAALRERGARIAIDDAGAGYAGLKHLMLLRPDIVKLDRGLVDGIAGDPAKQALIDAFVRFARQIGASVCAEGIENIEDLVVLADLDVAIGQGYVVGRPSEHFKQPQEIAVQALQEATAEAQRFGASQTSRPAFVADRHLELAAERLGAVSSYESIGPALATIAEALQADGICVSRVISGGAVLKTVATYAIQGESNYYSLADYPATRTVIDTGEAMQVIAGDPKADRIEVEALKIKHRSSLLMVPILSDGVGIGLLEAFASESRPWSRLGLARARLFAYQLGLLLEKIGSKDHSPEEHLAETRAALTALGSVPAGGRRRQSA